MIGLETWFLNTLAVSVTFVAGGTLVHLRRKERMLIYGYERQKTSADFLHWLNALPLDWDVDVLSKKITHELKQRLKPFEIFPRLWVLNNSWKTLEGVGEHPELRPGSPQHLPRMACPAFALRQPFHFEKNQTDACGSEQFNYVQHLCLPVVSESDCYGVLFLGSYMTDSWDAHDHHFLKMLAQSIALTLQRKSLFEKLKEKITELNFSFEVGVTTLATFNGSTQSIDETTLHLLDGVLSILKVDRASLMLWDPQTQLLETLWFRGGSFTVQSPLRLHTGEGMAGWALKTQQAYGAEYAMTDPHYHASSQPIQSLLCVPIFTSDQQPLGVINALTLRIPRTFTEREINFLTLFGRQAALAIENARLHQQSRRHIDQLKEINAMKSQFLSLVSHDLRGPLTGIRGFGEVLKMQTLGTLNLSQIELLDQMERQVELQERMVDDLLDLARMERGRFSIHPAPVDLRALLREEVEKSQLEARERLIDLKLFFKETDEASNYILDAGRVRQVIWNLIHNALKFTSEGGRITVDVSMEDHQALIEVVDTGVGLSADVQEHIFEKFFQVTPSGEQGAQGLGLGLAICKEIVAAHHGTIHARSPGLGRGTTISFTLPAPCRPTAAVRPSLAA